MSLYTILYNINTNYTVVRLNIIGVMFLKRSSNCSSNVPQTGSSNVPQTVPQTFLKPDVPQNHLIRAEHWINLRYFDPV